MKRFALAFALVLLMPLLASAQSSVCWQLQPYQEVMELSVLLNNPIGLKQMITLSGDWFSAGYLLTGAGHAVSTSAGFQLDVAFGNGTGFFANQSPVTLSATVDPANSLNGTWNFKGSQGFSDALGPKTLTRITCGLPLPPPALQALSAQGYAGGSQTAP